MASRGDRANHNRNRDPSAQRSQFQATSDGCSSRAASTTRDPYPPSGSRRSSTPGRQSEERRVRWEPQLERGATPSDPHGHRRASQSPSRSAMANPRARNTRLASVQLDREQEDFIHDRQTSSGTARNRTDSADAARDDRLCASMYRLRAHVDSVAREVCHSAPRDTRPAESLCQDIDNAQLLRYIGCLAMGGSRGILDWNEMLSDKTQASVLVMGILGRALREMVFSSLWFGGSEIDLDELSQQEEDLADEDGFLRTRKRADLCREFQENDSERGFRDLRKAETALVLQLEKMLLPLYRIFARGPVRVLPSAARSGLRFVVQEAARLSREMRMLDDIVYYWPPTFKDEEFDPQRMEAYNIKDMIEDSPYKKTSVNGHDTAVLHGANSADRSEAIVRIVGFPALVAYRQGGGSLAKKTLKEERKHENNAPPDVVQLRHRARDSAHNMTGREGFRTKVLCKSVVYLVWGKQRLLTREAGTSAHLDAKRDGKTEKYTEDKVGFVELYDFFMEKNPQAAAAMDM